MRDKVFIDTNILIYLYSEDELDKQASAYYAIEKYNCILSTQVLNEFSNVCLKKLKIPVEIIENSIDEISSVCKIAFISPEEIKKALTLHKKYGYSYYDCLILASAIIQDCKYLLSEDMNNKQIIENKLTILNIFAE